MSTEENKQVAMRFIKSTWERDADSVGSLLKDDLTYWTNGKLPRFTRIWTKPEFCALLKSPSPFKENLTFKIGEFFAEGSKVVMEVEGYGHIAKTGKIYNNTYCFLFTIHDGKIEKIREYMDTLHTEDVLPLPPV